MLEGVEMNGQHASELKQQGALEAARDPHSSVTADDAQDLVAKEAKASGAATFQFDPNASAEEKAAQAKATVPPELRSIRKHQATTLVTDQDDGSAPAYDLPTASKAGALPAVANTPAQAAAPAGQDWDKVGGAPRFGQAASKEEAGASLLDHQTFLEGKLDDKFFGDWYHNTGIIIFACLLSWVTAVLGGGLGWIILVMAICGTYYRTSIRRVRRNFRDDIRREMAKQQLETDHESLEWINSFLVKFWPIYSPVLCATIVSSVDQVLSTSTPAFLDSMRMKFFTLGTKPPRLEHVKTYPKAEDDIVLMDWKFSFTPNDTADLTARQIKNKVNPKIVLEVRVGKAMISKGLDIIVEDMAFSGLMRVKVKLQIPFPHVEKVDICFLERPTIDYVCKPLGGDMFGFDINFIPGLEKFIMEQVHANLGPMMYAPNVFPIEIAKMLAGNPVDQAVGVLQITFHGAQGLKNPDKFSGTPDPYATVSINGREALAKTKTVHENANPRWSETFNIILTSLKDNLTISVFDYNEFRKDKELGQATFALEKLTDDPIHESEQLELFVSGRPRGIVQADIRFFPVLESTKLADGTEQPPPESNTGIAKFTVESAKDLDGSKSMIGQLNPYAVLLLNGKEAHVSQKLKRTNNPIWPNATKELLITDRKSAKLGLVIKDERELGADPVIGSYQIKLPDMLDLMEKGQEWYTLNGATSGRVKMTLQWKPVALAGAAAGAGGYVEPIGVMRIHLKSASSLRNLETMGKSDPYARVLLSGIQKGRTVTFQNNLDPEWDEVIYVPVHSAREKLVVEVMDEETLGKDRSLGSIEIPTSDYIVQNLETGEYETHDSKKVIDAQLSLGRGQNKGVLHHTVSFFPAIPVQDPAEEEEKPDGVGIGVDVPRPSTEDKNGERKRAGTITSLKSGATLNSEPNGLSAVKEGEKLNGKQSLELASPVVGKPEVKKVKIGVDDLAQYESGLIVFNIIDGDIAQLGCHLEIIMDDNVFPAYSSAKTRSRHYAFNEVGDAMVRELDMSKITLRLIEGHDKKGSGEQDHVRAKLTGDTISVLKQGLYKPHEIALRDSQGRESKVRISLRFIPVKMKLDPSESVNNQGNLRIEVLDAADLPAADRNGFSDPFCKFMLNGKEVYKTQVQKKTLHPAWNESFDVAIRSRIAADFVVDVFDWDLGGSNDFLGRTSINLDILEPFIRQEVRLTLDGKSGAIRLGMLFKPDYVTRSRQGSSTFHGTFAAPGKVIGAPVKGVGKGTALIGGGVVKGASFLSRGIRGKSSRGDGDASNGNSPVIVTDDSAFDGAAERPGTASSAVPGEHGTAVVSVLSATGYSSAAKIQVHLTSAGRDVLKTPHLKKGETAFPDGEKRFASTAGSEVKLTVQDHGTFGSHDIAAASFAVGEEGEKTLSAGEGEVRVRLGWEAAPAGLGVSTADDAASLRGSVMGSPAGKSRRSLLRRTRENTPA